MKKSLQNCLKAVRKIEGKKLEDELGEGCLLYNKHTKQIVKINHQLCSSGDTGLYLKADEGKVLRWFVMDSSYGYDVDGEDVTEHYEILGNPNNMLQRVLGALNKKYGRELAIDCRGVFISYLEGKDLNTRNFVQTDYNWNHSKDIQEDSTYDKITELLNN